MNRPEGEINIFPHMVWTIPNLLCFGRIAAAPLIAVTLISENYVLATWIYLLAGLSDGVDGVIARRFRQSSQIGKILDPIADKAVVNTTFICLAVLGLLPFWFVGVVFLRDFGLGVAYLASRITKKITVFSASRISKLNTALQILLGLFIIGGQGYDFVHLEVRNVLVSIIVATTLVSAMNYLVRWLRFMWSED